MTTSQERVFLHLPAYRLIVCTECAFCVLPGALNRHLRDVHHLAKAARSVHLNFIGDLDLATNADEVFYPHRDATPVLGLPIANGFACVRPGCAHLCLAAKRMQAHWRETHGVCASTNDGGRQWKSVKLQTFFRGANLRYFAVTPEKPTPASTALSKAPANSLMVMSPSTLILGMTETEHRLRERFYGVVYQALFPCVASHESWRDRILWEADQHDFLRFALLSVSASHAALEYPDQSQQLRATASKHCDTALKRLPERISSVNPENFFAVFNFCRLVTLCCIAQTQCAVLESNDREIADGPILPAWVPLQRTTYEFLLPHTGLVPTGLYVTQREKYVVQNQEGYNTSRNPDDGHLEALALLFTDLDIDNDAVALPCLEALSRLRILWAEPYSSNPVVNFRDAALTWDIKLSEAYVDLVLAEEPRALIILAHVAVLWDMAEEHYWYMRGHAKAMLHRVAKRLPNEWLPWIAWPISRVGRARHGNLVVSQVQSVRDGSSEPERHLLQAATTSWLDLIKA